MLFDGQLLSMPQIYGLEENAPYKCALNAGLQGADASVPCFAGDCSLAGKVSEVMTWLVLGEKTSEFIRI